MAKWLVVALAAPTLASPALATRGPVLHDTSQATPVILAKGDKNEREASTEGKQPVCRPAVKPMTEGRVNRSSNCPKPRPILM